MTLRRLHRLNALLLAAFLILHLANHAALLGGLALHQSVMDALRPLYRGAAEPLLILLIALQAGLGLALARRRSWPRDGWGKARIASGLYLAFFLVQHVPAVLWSRPETGTAFAAAPVASLPLAAYFIPYYTLAVTALFTHVAAAIRHPARIALPPLGLLFGAVIVTGLRGAFG